MWNNLSQRCFHWGPLPLSEGEFLFSFFIKQTIERLTQYGYTFLNPFRPLDLYLSRVDHLVKTYKNTMIWIIICVWYCFSTTQFYYPIKKPKITSAPSPSLKNLEICKYWSFQRFNRWTQDVDAQCLWPGSFSSPHHNCRSCCSWDDSWLQD